MNQSYTIIASQNTESLAENLVKHRPNRFTYHKTTWSKFPDGTDHIQIGGFHPINQIANRHILFLANFESNDVTLSQFQVLIVLLQSFIKSLTIVLPYSPVGTMERVTNEGTVATANTYAYLFSSLPHCGTVNRLMIYDLHTLQNRFFLHGSTVASLHTAVPLLLQRLRQIDNGHNKNRISCGDGGVRGNKGRQKEKQSIKDQRERNDESVYTVAFPDDGAAKRFNMYFSNFDVIICGKTRKDNGRTVTIQSGIEYIKEGRNIIIVDDLVQTGGTLNECGKLLKSLGANHVYAYVTHAVFPNQSWKRFLVEGEYACFTKFWVTDSIPRIVQELKEEEKKKKKESTRCTIGNVFEVLELWKLILYDLDHYVTGNMEDYPDLL